MKPKKNPKADLRRRWVLFFQTGLILILFLSLQAFEWKNYKAVSKQDPGLNAPSEITEETPPVTFLPEKTAPPPLNPFIDRIKEVPDEVPFEETFLQPEEIIEELPEPEDIKTPEPIEEPVEIPYDFVERVPVYPGCENLQNNEERKACMSAKISNLVSREFDSGIASEIGLTGTNLVVVQFIVNRAGEVEQVKARAAHKRLEEEARRVIGEIPLMQPGRQQGNTVPVSYTIPIRFRVDE